MGIYGLKVIYYDIMSLGREFNLNVRVGNAGKMHEMYA